MSIYQYPHPWSPGFAIPKYVLAEPQGRGTFTTKQIPRGTIGTVPKNRQIYNRTRWAAPNYTQGRYDKTAQTTKMLPRRTVSLLVPDFFGRPSGKLAPSPGRGLVATGSTLDGATIGCETTLDGTSVGGESTLGKHAQKASAAPDPIVDYGKKGANIIVGAVMKLPRAQRKAQMERILDKISPGFRSSVEEKTKTYREAGRPAKDALKRGIAAALSNKMLSDMMHAGSKPFADLGDLWDDIGNKLAGIHCTVATSDITKTAATVAGGVYGGPAGAAAAGAGANVLAAPCGGGSSASRQPIPYAAPVASPSSPLIPIGIAAGGALILFFALR